MALFFCFFLPDFLHFRLKHALCGLNPPPEVSLHKYSILRMFMQLSYLSVRCQMTLKKSRRVQALSAYEHVNYPRPKGHGLVTAQS